MVCPKCNAKLDDDSRFCKFCGAAAMEAVTLQRAKKQRKLALLSAIVGLLLLICGMVMVFQFTDPFETIGIVLLYVSIALIAFAGIFSSITTLFKVLQARADKEAQRDKLMQDLAKKLDDLERTQKQ